LGLLTYIYTNHKTLIASPAMLEKFRAADPEFEGDDDAVIAAWVRKSHRTASNLVVKMLRRIAGNDLAQWAQTFFEQYSEVKRVAVPETRGN
jgi:deoxyinosine 3'endonuclease (endonuclease V)